MDKKPPSLLTMVIPARDEEACIGSERHRNSFSIADSLVTRIFAKSRRRAIARDKVQSFPISKLRPGAAE